MTPPNIEAIDAFSNRLRLIETIGNLHIMVIKGIASGEITIDEAMSMSRVLKTMATQTSEGISQDLLTLITPASSEAKS